MKDNNQPISIIQKKSAEGVELPLQIAQKQAGDQHN